MSHEITPWKMAGCALSVPVTSLSNRETFSREINETHGGDGGLNANYRQVEAALIVGNLLGRAGFNHGVDFVFKTVGDSVNIDFSNRSTMLAAQRILPEASKAAA